MYLFPEVATVTELHNEAEDDLLVGVRIEEEVVVRDDPRVVAPQQYLDLLERRVRSSHVGSSDAFESEALLVLAHSVRGAEAALAELLECGVPVEP